MKKRTAAITFGIAATLVPTAIVAIALPIRPLPPQSKTQHAERDLNGIRTVVLNLNTGNVKVVSEGSGSLQLEATRWAKGAGAEAVQNWIRNGDLSITRDQDVLKIGESQILKKVNNGQVHEDVTLHLPSGLAVDLHVQAGSVVAAGNFRSLATKVDAGDVNANFRVNPKGNSNINVGAGSVHVVMPEKANATLEAAVGVGQIKGLPSGSQEGLKVGDRRSGVMGSGAARVAIHVGAGHVLIDGPTAARPLVAETNEFAEKAQMFSLKQDSDDEDRDDHDQDDQDTSKIDRQVDEAMRNAQPEIDRAMKEAGPEIAKALAAIGPEIERAMAQVRPEIDRAIREARPEIERAKREHPEEYRKQMREMREEVRRAMAEAKRGLEKAQKEMNRKELRDIDPHMNIQKIVDEAMRAAHKAMDEAMRSTREIDKDANN